MGALCSMHSILTFAFANMAGDGVNLWRNRNSVEGSWGADPWNPVGWCWPGGFGWWDKDQVTPYWWCINSPKQETGLNFVYIGFSFVHILTQISFFPSLCCARQPQQSLCNSVWQVCWELAGNAELSAEWWLHLQPVLLTPCLHQCGARRDFSFISVQGRLCVLTSSTSLTEYCFLKMIRTCAMAPSERWHKSSKGKKYQGTRVSLINVSFFCNKNSRWSLMTLERKQNGGKLFWIRKN